MAIGSPTGGKPTAGANSESGAPGYTVVEIALPGVAGTEFTHILPASTKYFWVKTKGRKRVIIKHTTGGAEWKVKGGSIFRSPELTLAATLTITMESPDTGDTVEIIQWA